MLRRLSCLILAGSACVHHRGAPVEVSTASKTPEQIAPTCVLPATLSAWGTIQQHGTVLDAYQLEGGVWLDRAPVLVNEEFDFALAMGLESAVGAGLAAAKRKQSNAQKAALLTEIVVPPDLRRRLDELRCCGVHVYFLLWGAESAVLRTVADVPQHRARSRVTDSAARPLHGELGWATEGVLSAQAGRSVAALDCEHTGALHP